MLYRLTKRDWEDYVSDGRVPRNIRREVLGSWQRSSKTHNLGLKCAPLLAGAGYTSSVVLSITGEEAPVSVTAWVKQRSRWMKGFCQTTLVHGILPRAPRLRDRIALAVQLSVRLICIASHPVGMAVAANDPHGPLAVLLFTGYALTIAVFTVAARRAGRPVRDALALPAYSFLHAIALGIAVVELVVAPSHWAKTAHGLVDPRARQRVATGG